MTAWVSGVRAGIGIVLLASLAAVTAGCGAQQVHFALPATKICGRIITMSPTGITQFSVDAGQHLTLGPDFLAFNPAYPGSAEAPIALRLSPGCAVGALGIRIDTPGILRLGKMIRGTKSGIIAILVYGVGNGTGTLTVNEAPGRTASIAIPVTTK